MNALIVAFAAMLAVASAGIHGVAYVAPVAHGAVLQGPGSHAAVVGPDGSQIIASEQGGAIVADGHVGGIVAHHAAPIAYHGAHVAAYHAAPVAYAVHGYEGQYVPSGLETLYDDGSYKPELHHAEHYAHYY